MKNFIVSSVVLLSAIAVCAQPQTISITNQTGTTRPAHSKGVSIGLAYAKFVEVNFKMKGTSTENSNGAKSDYSFDSNQKNNLPLVGLNVGYKNNYAFGQFGFSSSATLFKSGDKDQLGSDISIIKAQGDVVYPINDKWNISIGPNIGYLAGVEKNDAGDKVTSAPGLGAQAGVQVQMLGVGVMVGYQTLGFYETSKQSNSFSNSESNVDFRASGFISQIDYTF